MNSTTPPDNHAPQNSQSQAQLLQADENESRRLLPLSASPKSDAVPIKSKVDDDEEAAYDARQKILIADFELDSPNYSGAPPFSWKKLWMFTGPGFLMSIAFLDLQAARHCGILPTVAADVGDGDGAADSAVVSEIRGGHGAALGGALPR